MIISICKIAGDRDLADKIKKYEFPLYNENHNIIKSHGEIEKVYKDIDAIIGSTDSDKKNIIKQCLDCSPSIIA